MAIPLCPAEILLLRGADAVAFAHAQFTSDVKSLPAGEWQWSAWLDAQGRVRFFFVLLHAAPSRLLAWLPLGGAEPMRDALARFVFRAAVQIDVSTWTLHALDAAGPALAARRIAGLDGGYALLQPGTPQRIAWLAPADAAGTDPRALDRWRRADIEAGLPLLAPSLGAEFVPQALDLERLDAIRFDKGCYPGQEIAARLHFRGGNKRRLRRVRIAHETADCGATVYAAPDAPAGRILYSAGLDGHDSSALAVLADGASTQSLVSASGARITLCE
jgi:folate-binding protein YgfZ